MKTWKQLTVICILAIFVTAEVLSLPLPVDYFQYSDFNPRRIHSDIRLWGWSRNSNVAYTNNINLDPMDGYIFTAVIFNTINDTVIWQDSINSNDFEENAYNAALEIFINNFKNTALQNGIEFMHNATEFPAQIATQFPAQIATQFPAQIATQFPAQADFRRLPIRHGNQTVNIIVETGEITGDWHEVFGNIGSYRIIAEIATEFPAQRGGRRKTIHEKKLNRPVKDVITCGYFLSPFENRALIVVGEYEWAFEGYDVKYVLIGCHLSIGFR